MAGVYSTNTGNSSGKKDEEEDVVPGWDANWLHFQQQARWYVNGTKKEDRSLLAFRVARRLRGATVAHKSKFVDVEMEKETGIEHLLQILKTNVIGTHTIDMVTKVMAYLVVHRKPKQDFQEYFSAHDDAVTELNEALKAIGETVNKLPDKFVSFLHLERTGLQNEEKAVVKARAGDDYDMKKHREVLLELWPREAILLHDGTRFLWWSLRPRADHQQQHRRALPAPKRNFRPRPRTDDSAHFQIPEGDDDHVEHTYMGEDQPGQPGEEEEEVYAADDGENGEDDDDTEEAHVALEEEKAMSEEECARDNVLESCMVQSREARSALNAARTSRGFYPVVAMVPPESIRTGRSIPEPAPHPRQQARPKFTPRPKPTPAPPRNAPAAPVCTSCGGPHLARNCPRNRSHPTTPSGAGAPRMKRQRGAMYAFAYMAAPVKKDPEYKCITFNDCDCGACMERVRVVCPRAMRFCWKH